MQENRKDYEHTPSKSKKWPWLIISIAINFFLIGITVAPLLHAPAGMPPQAWPPMGLPHQEGRGFPPPPEPRMILDRLSAQMPPADAKIFKSLYEQEEKKLYEGHEKMRQSMHALGEVLRAEKPDLNELTEILNEVEAGQSQIHITMGKIIQHVATDLSPDSRHKIADFLEHMP